MDAPETPNAVPFAAEPANGTVMLVRKVAKRRKLDVTDESPDAPHRPRTHPVPAAAKAVNGFGLTNVEPERRSRATVGPAFAERVEAILRTVRYRKCAEKAYGNRRAGLHTARYARGVAQFEVQTIDPDSGLESWVLVSAPTVESARHRVTETGMRAGVVKLKAMDEPAHPASDERTAGHGVRCPSCGADLIPRGSGMHGFEEVAACTVLVLIGLLPGVVYYIWLETKPYCPMCRRRV